MSQVYTESALANYGLSAIQLRRKKQFSWILETNSPHQVKKLSIDSLMEIRSM